MGCHCGLDSIGSASKDHKKGVALRVHDVSVPLSECCVQDLAALHIPISSGEGLEKWPDHTIEVGIDIYYMIDGEIFQVKIPR